MNFGRPYRQIAIIAGLALSAASPCLRAASVETGGAASNPYAVIVDRNIFRLNPPPPPPPPPEAKPADLPKYMLTGIVTIGDQTRALFALASKDAKEPPTYLNLLAGEQQGDLKVASIDTKKREVAIVNSGTPMTLSALSNSFASAAPAGPAEGPGAQRARRLPGFPAPPTPINPAGTATAAAQGGGGGAVIIGGSRSGTETQGVGGSVAQNGGGNYASPNYGGGYSGGGGGVSVSGGEPVNYGATPGMGNVSLATPNSVPISLGGTTPTVNPANNWPPVEPADPLVQQAALMAASQGIGLDNGNSSSGVTVNGSGSGGNRAPSIPPPALPIIPPRGGKGE